MSTPVVEQFITFTPNNDNKYSYLDVLNVNKSCVIRQDNVYTSLENASIIFVEHKTDGILLHGTTNTTDKLDFTATVTPYGTKITTTPKESRVE